MLFSYLLTANPYSYLCLWLWQKEESPIWFSSSPHSQTKPKLCAEVLWSWFLSLCCCSHFLGEFINTSEEQLFPLNPFCKFRGTRSNTNQKFWSELSQPKSSLSDFDTTTLEHRMVTYRLGEDSHLPGTRSWACGQNRSQCRSGLSSGLRVNLWSQ